MEHPDETTGETEEFETDVEEAHTDIITPTTQLVDSLLEQAAPSTDYEEPTEEEEQEQEATEDAEKEYKVVEVESISQGVGGDEPIDFDAPALVDEQQPSSNGYDQGEFEGAEFSDRPTTSAGPSPIPKPLAKSRPSRKSIKPSVQPKGVEAEPKRNSTYVVEEPIIIEEIAVDADDSMFGFHLAPSESVPSIHTSQLDIKTLELAREIAEYVLDLLEFDVNRYFSRFYPRKKVFLKRSGSSISVLSSFGDIDRLYVKEASTMNLFYEKGEPGNRLRLASLVALPTGKGVDAECQVHLHRSLKRFGRGPKPTSRNAFAQTREMTLVSSEEAERAFRHLYPLKDNYVAPAIPKWRPAMLAEIEKAENEQRNIDRAKVGPKVKWSKKPRLLPPLPQNYNKVESFWTGSTYRGKYADRQFVHGFFNYPLMSTFESEFYQGQMQTRKHLGLVKFPRGDKFEGNWRRGRHLAGRITFCDELEFSPHNWPYCVAPDRRFYIERDVGVKQAGRTLYNDRLPPPHIPPGMYDTGDGFYNPADGVVTGFNGDKLRVVDRTEHDWIRDNCRQSKVAKDRYLSCFNIDRLPCSYTEKYVQQ